MEVDKGRVSQNQWGPQLARLLPPLDQSQNKINDNPPPGRKEDNNKLRDNPLHWFAEDLNSFPHWLALVHLQTTSQTIISYFGWQRIFQKKCKTWNLKTCTPTWFSKRVGNSGDSLPGLCSTRNKFQQAGLSLGKLSTEDCGFSVWILSGNRLCTCCGPSCTGAPPEYTPHGTVINSRFCACLSRVWSRAGVRTYTHARIQDEADREGTQTFFKFRHNEGECKTWNKLFCPKFFLKLIEIGQSWVKRRVRCVWVGLHEDMPIHWHPHLSKTQLFLILSNKQSQWVRKGICQRLWRTIERLPPLTLDPLTVCVWYPHLHTQSTLSQVLQGSCKRTPQSHTYNTHSQSTAQRFSGKSWVSFSWLAAKFIFAQTKSVPPLSMLKFWFVHGWLQYGTWIPQSRYPAVHSLLFSFLFPRGPQNFTKKFKTLAVFSEWMCSVTLILTSWQPMQSKSSFDSDLRCESSQNDAVAQSSVE